MILYINNYGFLNFNISKIKSSKKNQIKIWSEYINLHYKEIFYSCHNASVIMHKKLKNIDQVAWDWIPSTREPILLEGNSFFSLLEPQQFLYLQTLV